MNGHAVCIIPNMLPHTFDIYRQAGAGLTAFQLPFDFRFVWSGAKLTFPFVRRGIPAEGACIAFKLLSYI